MHIVIVNRWPRFADGLRWDNELTRYEEFVDHDRHQVSYVVDEPGARGVLVAQEKIAHLVRVDDVNVFTSLRDAVAEVVEKVGPVDRLIALSEFTLEIAARVREDLGIPGPTTAEVAVYRDKVRMKEILSGAGVRVPAFESCVDLERCRAFAAGHGYPVILKPVDGAASIGVHRVDDDAALTALLPTVDLSRYEIEEFVAGTVFHVDGYADAHAEITFHVVSRYLNDCLEFAAGAPLGSVVVGPSALRDRVERFARECVSVLAMRNLPFHLELFVTPGEELVFLEIGGRVAGGDVPYLTHELFGVNLYETWLRDLSGEPVPLPVKDGDASGGWLIIPKPAWPVRVVRSSSMAERMPTVWRELVPRVGDVLEPGGSYDSLHSGRFILLGADEDRLEADIRHIIGNYDFEVAPL